MSKVDLKILAAYRMYQAPPWGRQIPHGRTYLNLPYQFPLGRGGGVAPAPAPSQCQGQNMSALNLVLLDQLTKPFPPIVGGRVSTLDAPSRCPVMNTLNPSSQKPSDRRSVAKPTSQTSILLFDVTCIRYPT